MTEILLVGGLIVVYALEYSNPDTLGALSGGMEYGALISRASFLVRPVSIA